MADTTGGHEDEDSLDNFEKKIADDEKKKGRKQLILVGLVVLFAVVAGAYYYLNFYGAATTAEAPAPTPAPAPEKVEKPAAPVEKPVEVVKAAPEPVKKAAAKAKPEKSAKKGKESKGAEKAEAKEAAKGEKKTAEPGGRIIQLGVFSVEANAKKLAERVEKAGLTPELVKVEKKLGTAVYYEPKFKYRELAEEALGKLKSDGFEGKVILTGPGEYSVEVGSFLPGKKNETPVEKLKEKGYETRAVPKAAKSSVTVVRIAGIEDEAKLHETTDKLEKEKIPFVVKKH